MCSSDLKNHVVPTSWQEEALARDGVSREVPCSALKGETFPDKARDPVEVAGPLGTPSRVASRVSWSPLSSLN